MEGQQKSRWGSGGTGEGSWLRRGAVKTDCARASVLREAMRRERTWSEEIGRAAGQLARDESHLRGE